MNWRRQSQAFLQRVQQGSHGDHAHDIENGERRLQLHVQVSLRWVAPPACDQAEVSINLAMDAALELGCVRAWYGAMGQRW